ncbi:MULTISPECIES: rRNA maturation RNase YbeY [unclassified Anabaena]|uniref:rRNA maturation RNase YbeY n=1 Tax=unclassified Anabaena TaxID=2619674 RepID=UPI002B1F740E|nr:rRNA maturation RNase YbeY [Anabaena sp. UHCC 0399]MEA5569012.1 rRNA maturation RNase YbeY [Anabaena sp. UHCC 0399]
MLNPYKEILELVEFDLDVQDVFCESSLEEALKSNYLENQIASETWKNWFDCWLDILQPHLPPASSYEIGLRLTNDVEIQELNAQYRQQNKPTDVLSFAALEVDFPQVAEMSFAPLYLGDIVISVNTAQCQAQQQEHSLSTEFAWLVAHGLLHLLGWDHPDEESLTEMLKQQAILLRSIGIHIDIEY